MCCRGVAFVLVGVTVAAAAMEAGAQPATAAPAARPAPPAAAILTRPAFSATPADLLAAARAVPADGDAPVTLLREEFERTFDAQGRARARWRFVFVIRTQAGVDDWGSLSTTYHPFFQDRPTVRARVIAPGGAVTPLDTALISEAPVVTTDTSVLSDERELTIPLPRLGVGAIIEEEMITQDRVPMLGEGTVSRRTIGRAYPIHSLAITLSAPTSLRARAIARHLPAGAALARTSAAGRDTWTLVRTDVPVLPDTEALAPDDAARTPWVGIATGASWQAVARGYRAIVERQLAAGPITLPASLPRTASIATARALVAWLHQQVRYTGIEYGAAAITPWTPAETLARGFGDCKDKATLLVALLRQAGIRADLALLSTGPGVDVDPALPGLGGFDHAIVRAVVDGQPLWIDATEDLHAPGTLPARDQGRLALVISEDGVALARTPRATARDNAIREVRTFALPEYGYGQVTEVSREGGAYEVEGRAWIRDARADDVKADLARYASSKYDGALARYSTTPPTDLGQPFEITTVVKATMRAYASRNMITVSLAPGDVMVKLPALLVSSATDEPDRRADVELRVPHTHEIENRLEIPPGFELPSPAPATTRALGALTFSEAQRLDGRTLVITFRFDTGEGRIRASELAPTRAALRAFKAEERRIVIETEANALAGSGRLREALAATRALIAAHPKKALHHSQLAELLTTMGAGPAARAAARRAVTLAPRDADTHALLGWVLRHDSLGRDFGFDADRAGALTAFARARALDPTHVGAALMHAETLARDARGRVGGVAAADLTAAAEARRKVQELDPSDDHGIALTDALLQTGKPAEAEAVAKGLAASDKRDLLYLVAAAQARGIPAAIALAQELRPSSTRTLLLGQVAGGLLAYRAYDDARAMTAQIGGLGQAAIEPFVRRWQRAPTSRPADDPRTATANTMFDLFDPGALPSPYWDPEVARAIRATVPHDRATEALQAFLAIGVDVGTDLVSSVPELTVEGRPRGPWRVRVELAAHTSVLYVALDRGVAKVIGGTAYLRGVGAHARRLLATGDEAGARQCIAWADEQITGQYPTQVHRIMTWPRPSATAPGRAAIGLAAAQLARDALAVPVLESCASTDPTARAACDDNLIFAYGSARAWPALAIHLGALRAVAPAGARAALDAERRMALRMAGNYADAEALTAAAIAVNPDDVAAHRDRALTALHAGRVPEALSRFDTLAARDEIDADDVNLAAWLRLTSGVEAPRALVLATLAVQLEPTEPNPLHTLALARLETGDLRGAYGDAKRVLQLAHRQVPEGPDWLLFGRLWEHLGLRDDAIAAYRRVGASTDGIEPGSSHALARTWLTRLGAK